MLKRFAVLLLLVACAHAPPCLEPDFCPSAVPAEALDDPAALHALILDARTRRFPPAECSSCEEGTPCFSCERFVELALARLASLGTERAAEVAAAVVADQRMGWDGGPALRVAYHVSRMGPIVLPHLKALASRSTFAQIIVDCMEHNTPCY